MSIGKNWTICYTDFSTYSDLDGPIENAPGLNVLGIIIPNDRTGYRHIHGGNAIGHGFYWFENGEWFCGDFAGLLQYVADPGYKVILLGRAISTSKWLAYLQWIEENWGPRSSHWPGERV